MSAKIKDHRLFGTEAAACALCCAPPLLALLGIAAAALATVATIAFAGLGYGLAMQAASLLGMRAARRARTPTQSCPVDGPASGPVVVTIGPTPPSQS